jgi:uncharacterized protein VirK/YbjX
MRSHYRFEDTTFDAPYKAAVYTAGGLPPWQQLVGASEFSIRLEMASRTNAESELTISLLADNKPLHRLSFSGVDGAITSEKAPMVPLIACNHGWWTDSGEALAAF